MTAPEQGTITGVVNSVIFKGMHYEIIVQSGDNEVVIQSTKECESRRYNRYVSGVGRYSCNSGGDQS